MPAPRPFKYGDKDYLQRLNDMLNVLMPAVPGPVNANRAVTFDDNGQIIDCSAALTLTPDATTLVDGFNCVVNANSGGTVTITAPFIDNTASKTITVGNGALITCNGVKYRIARFAIV